MAGCRETNEVCEGLERSGTAHPAGSFPLCALAALSAAGACGSLEW